MVFLSLQISRLAAFPSNNFALSCQNVLIHKNDVTYAYIDNRCLYKKLMTNVLRVRGKVYVK